MGYIGVITHLLTFDPNFLGHPSSHSLEFPKQRPQRLVDGEAGRFSYHAIQSVKNSPNKNKQKKIVWLFSRF